MLLKSNASRGRQRRRVVAGNRRVLARAMLSRVLNSQAAQRAAAFLLAAYLRFALGTTRWTWDGEAHVAPFIQGGKVVVVFWHECLPLMPAVWRYARRQNPNRRGYVLVSRHRDGRFIGTIMERFGVTAVHGSSSVAAGKATKDRGGPSSLRALLTVLAAGDAVVMTPDGPRGPARKAAPGAAQLAAVSGAPLLPTAVRLRHRLILKTWDHMILPLPFGKGALVSLPPIPVPPDSASAAQSLLEASLSAAAARAEMLTCGA